MGKYRSYSYFVYRNSLEKLICMKLFFTSCRVTKHSKYNFSRHPRSNERMDCTDTHRNVAPVEVVEQNIPLLALPSFELESRVDTSRREDEESELERDSMATLDFPEYDEEEDDKSKKEESHASSSIEEDSIFDSWLNEDDINPLISKELVDNFIAKLEQKYFLTPHLTAPAAYEFQHRGLPHIHNAIIYVDPTTMAEEQMNKKVITMVS